MDIDQLFELSLPSVSEVSIQFSSVTQSCRSLRPRGLQHTRLPCLSPTLGANSNSSIESVMPSKHLLDHLLLLPSGFPSIWVFSNKFFTSGGRSIGVSASASVLPMNIQDWFTLVLTGWISVHFKRLSSVSFNTTVQKHWFFSAQLLYSPTLTSIRDY